MLFNREELLQAARGMAAKCGAFLDQWREEHRLATSPPWDNREFIAMTHDIKGFCVALCLAGLMTTEELREIAKITLSTFYAESEEDERIITPVPEFVNAIDANPVIFTKFIEESESLKVLDSFGKET